MRIGFISVFDRERIAFARQHGFTCVELHARHQDPHVPGHEGWKDRTAEIKAAYDEAGIRISCLAGFYCNHMDADPAVARSNFEHVRNVIRLARELRVPVVAGFAGRIVGEDLEASLPAFTKIWSEHARAAEDAGVKIAFEHCPMGRFHSPFGGNNCFCTPAMWERCFDAVPSEALGIEWDASHLVCQMIDPVVNLRQFGRRVHHVHAKDARVYRDVVDRYGMYHPGATEHCFPGLGDSGWGTIVKELRRAGYHGDLNIEGWHDQVFRNHPEGPQLENLGLLVALRHLSQFVDGE
ncbi:MAG TPA: sugar phosphate isomerase/epimerase [Phycisphaerae bacterium]|nr:sugar phosphate isomerase/epimerase [Phycisphaerae bacterium]